MSRPPASTSGVASRMAKQPRRDTKPEVELRRLLHAAGLRYRVDYRPVPELRRKADIVFRRAQIAVFVHGCFWHRCPIHATAPKANAQWWDEKLSRNVERDRDTRAVLEAAGWAVIEVWEHELPAVAAERVMTALADRGRGVTSS
jgi:DNA mismatch endonuclease (patch repair protein)